MAPSPLTSTILFHLGPLTITRPVVTTWAIMAVLTLVSWLVTRRLRLHPDRRQTVLELIVTGIMAQIEEVIRKNPRPFLPLLGTLFIVSGA
jgi:F-type H+-transporting ATPase subunit a